MALHPRRKAAGEKNWFPRCAAAQAGDRSNRTIGPSNAEVL
jgi:hypothetical protein